MKIKIRNDVAITFKNLIKQQHKLYVLETISNLM